MIKNICITDPIESHTTGAIEVELDMDDSSKRWCFFFTPQGVAHCGDLIDGTNIRVHYGELHMFIVSNISKDIIEATLKKVENEGELLQRTLPF